MIFDACLRASASRVGTAVSASAEPSVGQTIVWKAASRPPTGCVIRVTMTAIVRGGIRGFAEGRTVIYARSGPGRLARHGMTATVPDTILSRLYGQMLRIRLFEDEAHRLFLRNEIEGSIHLYQGQEAVAVGVCSLLEPPRDVVAATYRGHGACLALGSDPARLFGELLGRENGLCGGRSGSMNVVDLEHGLLGCFAIVGGSLAAATGAALASKLRHDRGVAVAFFGDGAANQAYFHES